jgi:hypothetical protein
LLALFEVAPFWNREAMAARSRGRKPTDFRQIMTLSREAATAFSARSIPAAASRLTIFLFHFLRAYARSYVRSPLRG